MPDINVKCCVATCKNPWTAEYKDRHANVYRFCAEHDAVMHPVVLSNSRTPSINDWAAKAAHRVFQETLFWNWKERWAPRNIKTSEARIAAIIALHAEPLVKLLRESRREHVMVEDGVCYKATVDEDEMDDAECTCGADTWNARIDEALSGIGAKSTGQDAPGPANGSPAD